MMAKVKEPNEEDRYLTHILDCTPFFLCWKAKRYTLEGKKY
jgi:hypothetical protein